MLGAGVAASAILGPLVLGVVEFHVSADPPHDRLFSLEAACA